MVGITICGVDKSKLDILSDPKFIELTKFLGEKPETKVMKIMADLPAK